MVEGFYFLKAGNVISAVLEGVEIHLHENVLYSACFQSCKKLFPVDNSLA
jgi:hypothetical protein